MITVDANLLIEHSTGTITVQNNDAALKVEVSNWKTLILAYHTFVRMKGRLPHQKLSAFFASKLSQKIEVANAHHTLVELEQTTSPRIYWWRLFKFWFRQLFGNK